MPVRTRPSSTASKGQRQDFIATEKRGSTEGSVKQEEEEVNTHQTKLGHKSRHGQTDGRRDGRTQRQRRGEGPQTQLRAAAVSIPAACSSLQPRTLKQSLHLNAMLTTKAWSEKYNRHVSRASSGHCLPPPQGSVSAHHSALSWLEGRIIRDPQP